MGVTILNKDGFCEIVLWVTGLVSSEGGGRGRGSADSDHSEIVGVGGEDGDHKLYRKYFGRNPRARRYDSLRALLFSMSRFLTTFADVAVPTVCVRGRTSGRGVETIADVGFAP